MSKVTFGNNIGAKQWSFMLDKENKILHTAWFPLIEVNGKMATIKDDSYPVGIKEAESRYKARKMAKEFLDRLKEET